MFKLEINWGQFVVRFMLSFDPKPEISEQIN
jgi:hypothetical protein